MQSKKLLIIGCLFLVVPLLFTPQFSQAQVTYSISGTATLAGAGLAGVSMSLTGDATATATTDANGDYSFSGLDNGTYTVTPTLAGYTFAPANAPATISGADVTGIDFAATTILVDVSISGTVTLGAVGLPGVTMTLSGDATATATTDANGDYSFFGLDNGTYTVTPTLAGYTFDPANTPVTISGADVSGIDFAATAIPPATYSISGIATLAGAGLAGVTITLSGDASATTTTDANGDYSFPGLDNGTYTVTPTLAGYTFDPTNTPVTISGADVSGIDFAATAIPPALFEISGTVTLGGSGFAGVTITLSGDASATTTTDANGDYSFPGLVNGDYTVTPSLAGYTFDPTNTPVTISGADVSGIDFAATAIPPGTYSISGTATLAGAGLFGVTMTLSGDATATATTDANGDYSFSGLDNGTYTVTPTLAGYTFDPTNTPVTISGADETGVDFVATAVPPDTFAISGTVTLGGAGLAGVTMTLTGDATATTTTDANGDYAFPGLVNGDYTVMPSLAGYTFDPTNTPVTISGADETGVDFVATAVPPDTFAISGTVTLGGAGLAGVTMTLTGDATATTTTDANGDYSFPGLDNGTYTVAPTLAGYTFDPTNTPITISGADETGVDFVATAIPPDTFAISGTVTLGGTGLAGVIMTLSGDVSSMTTTDADGNYSFPGLDNGDYTVTPSLAGFSFAPASAPVSISGADETGVDFVATVIPPATFEISGTVTLGGSGFAGVTITLSGDASATTTTDANGDYSFAGLLNGGYSVTPSLAGYTFDPSHALVTVSNADATGIDFIATAIHPGSYSISGSVTNSRKAGVAGVTMTLSGDAAATTITDANGDYSFPGLAKGRYTVTPTLGGYQFAPPARQSVKINKTNVTGVDFKAIKRFSDSLWR